MSRIGDAPIQVPQGVQIRLSDHTIQVKGPRGELSRPYDARLRVEQQDGTLLVQRNGESKQEKALHGLTRTLLANMVEGVTRGYEKKLEMHSSQGDVYRAQKQGENLVLQLGFSHPVEVQPRPGISFDVTVPARTGAGAVTGIITISGSNKEDVGQQAAEIRSLRPPEPYKGKGIRYEGEFVRRKAGKAGKAGAKGGKGKK